MRVLAVDSNSILNRAFYGIKQLTTADGRYTNGIFGYMNIFLKLCEDTSPDAVVLAFDLKAPTFRHKMYESYKANRKPMPSELAQQMPVLKELLTALGYKICEVEGFEADDILGTVAAMCGKDDVCFIGTGDRDSFQLIRDNVTVLLPHTKQGRTQTEVYTPQRIFEEYGVTPQQMIDIKALQGDSSDNIPGVGGVGEKTAGELIKAYGSVESIYSQIDSLDIRPRVKEKLIADRDKAFLSYTLGTIATNAPINGTLGSFIPSAPDMKKAGDILKDLEMTKLAQRLGVFLDFAPEEKPKKTAEKIEYTESGDITDLCSEAEKAGELFLTLGDGAFYFSFGKTVCKFDFDGFREQIVKLLSDGGIKKYTDNSKALYRFAMAQGFSVQNVVMDTALAGYILNPSAKSYEPCGLCSQYKIPVPSLDNSAPEACGCAVLKGLSMYLIEEIRKNGQEKLLYEVELPLALVLADMEHTGFCVDREGIERFSQKISAELEQIKGEIYTLADGEFNINSPKQLGSVLFEKLHLPVKKKTKSGYSTNAEVLEELKDENPIVEKILWFRTLSKLYSTYCEGLLKVIGEDGRIHSSFIQTETRTGRISSTEPNLQNIPVRKSIGREMRKFFVAGDGCMLADADYSQIELRVLAHIADDTAMLTAFKTGVDIHTETASQVFGMPPEMVTPLMRSRAKAVNFGIVYGIGAFSLAKDIGVTRKEADEYIKGYLRHYKGVNEYMDRVVKEASENGYVSTLWGRRRYLPELSSGNRMMRSFGERVARNMPIQGTAADIIKIAMVRVYNRLKEEKMQAKLILQVHDELIVEAPEAEIERAAQILGEEMENACKMKVKLSADVHTGKTWYDAKG